MAKTLPPLKRSEVDTAAKIMLALKQSGSATEQRLREYLRGQGLETKAKQDAAFRLLAGMHAEIAKDIDAILAQGVEQAAGIGHQEAAKAIEGESVRRQVLRYDPKRTAKYLSLITPENGRGLAAVFTDKMTERAVKDLRRITVDTFRQADLNAWTANERQKELQKAWDVAAGDLNAFRFIDQGGKQWDNARYLQMLVRTTQARVHRESYADTLVENGDDLAIVTPAGDNCPTCQAWAGIIVSVSGTNEKYPAYGDAVDAGLFHPNCIPGDAEVLAGNVLAAFRFRFQGDLIRIVLSGGRSLRVSPNHPVLSSRGWVAAKELHQRDKVFSASGGEGVFCGAPDIDHAPSRADQVFMALSKAEGVRSSQMPIAAEHFHGDAAFGNGQVEIIWTDRPLRLHSEPGGLEGARQLVFRPADIGRNGMPPNGDLAAMLNRVGLATNRRMSSPCPLHPLLLGGVGMPSGQALAWRAQGDTGGLQDAGEPWAANSGCLVHGEDIFAGLVSADDVLRVEREWFDGHLYDLLTVEGCYLTGDKKAIAIVSNCDCTLERADETLDAENIAKQAQAKTPEDLEDLDAMREYRDAIGIETPTRDEARTDFSELAMERYKDRLAKRAK